MSQQTVPGNVRPRERGKPFPKGFYFGHVGQVEADWNRNGSRYNLSVRFENMSSADEDTTEPGPRPFIHRITLNLKKEAIDKRGRKVETEYLVYDVDLTDEDIPYGIRAAAGELADLAVALGAASVREDGSVQMDSDLETFVEELRQGSYADALVAIEISHRPWKNDQTGNEGINVNPVFYHPDEVEAAPPAAEVETATEEETEEDEAEGDDAGDVVPEEESKAAATVRKLGK